MHKVPRLGAHLYEGGLPLLWDAENNVPLPIFIELARHGQGLRMSSPKGHQCWVVVASINLGIVKPPPAKGV